MASQYLKLLGHEVEDKVTGYKGVVDSIQFDLYGCVQVAVIPKIKLGETDQEKTRGRYFDHKRLTVTSAVPVMPQPVFAVPGAEPGPAEAKPSFAR